MTAMQSVLLGVPKPAWRRRLADRLFLAVCIGAAAASVLILLVLVGSVVRQGWSHLTWNFLNSFPSRNAQEAGLKAALWGTVWLCALCVLLAVPIGVATAVLLEEYAPRGRAARRLHSFVQLNIRNLSGVPSIVYGIIGLTVFVRCFGVLGNPNQYDQMIRASLSDGSIVEGFLVEDQPASIVLDVEGVEGAAQAEGMPWPQGMEISLAQVREGVTELSSTSPGARVEVSVLRDFNLPLELTFALVPVDDSPEPARLNVKGTLREVRAGRLVLDRPVGGRVEIPTFELKERGPFAVRGHELRLASGEIVRGGSLANAGESGWAIASEAEPPRMIPREAIQAYRAIGPLAVGREDSFFYFRIPLGGSVLAGALTLMLVILPVVIISSQEALRAVPRSLREGAFAAGATRWQMVSRMVLPSAIPGIMTGVILAMSRAIGEAAPLLVIGGILFITFTPTNVMSDFAAMPLQIYQWASRPQPEFYEVAASGIIVLLVVLLAFNAAAILLRQKFQKHSR